MAKQTLFASQNSINLNNYKDNNANNPVSVVNNIMNKHNILIVPKHIYKHLAKYNGFSLSNIHEYLSYEDTALLIGLNERFLFDKYGAIELLTSLPVNYKINVDFIMKTKSHLMALDEFTLANSDSDKLYEFINIDNFIYVVVEPGISRLLQNQKQKADFLTNLSALCFNVMGDSNTYAQPFFEELVQVI